MSDRAPLPRWLLAAAGAVVLVPLVVAVVAQRQAGWHPVYDLAMTELRVRDVGGPHTPLIGLQGRIGPSGSHPGPLSFYVLAPTYRVFGSTAWALQVATAVLHGLAVGVALWVASRRRDPRLVVGVAVVLLLLMQGYGLGPLTEPWNPQLPLLWFVAFLVAAWAVLDGDLPMLVVAVGAASMCAQTHVPYLAVTSGIGAVVVAVVGLRVWRSRGEPGGSGWWWVAASGAVGLLLWVPPLVDQVVHDPGNLSQIVDHLATPTEEPIGVRQAVGFVVERLDAWQLVVVEAAHPGTYIDILGGPGPQRWRGTATLVAWLACAAASVWRRQRLLMALHALVAVGVAVAVTAISRIYGVPWPYLMQWAFAIGALMALAIVATLGWLLSAWAPRWVTPRAVTVAGALAAVAVSIRLLAVAPDATTGTPDQTGQLARLVRPTVEALDAGEGAATGEQGSYLVLWSDAVAGGSEGIGLVNELIRRGFDAGVPATEGVKLGVARVRAPEEVTARVVFASGGWIDHWADEPGAVRVAYDDPRSPAQQAEFERVRGEAIEALETAGRTDLVERIDTDLFDVALNGGVPASAHLLLGRLLELGVDAAVFVLPAMDA